MRCNACWRELEGRAITTTCGHLLCIEDAGKILSNNEACPVCDQVLSKSLMKPVDINPSDEWVNMVMAGVSPQISLKSTFKSIMFYIQQNELEMQTKMNKVVAQCRKKCEAMQEKFTEKMEQVYSAYQKIGKRCQILEQQVESLSKDNQELKEKFAEKCRQKRKLDEMYDEARNEIESLKRSAIQPASHFFSRPETDLFSNPTGRLDNRDQIRNDWRGLTPDTPGPRDDMWPPRNNNSNSTFDISGGSPAKQTGVPMETRSRVASGHPPSFGAGGGAGSGNPSMTLRNLILSPIRQPHLSRNRSHLFI